MRLIKVLLVEDEALIRVLAAELLRDAGFDVTEAQSGDEAASMLPCTGRFDILFTDVRMPGLLDGIHLALLVRSQWPNMPVLVVSGFAERLASRLAELDPAAAYLSKPYDMQEVHDTVTRLTLV